MFGCSFTIFFARCYICPLIHNILRSLSSPVGLYLPVDSHYYILRPLSSHIEIADSISLPVEVTNSTIELYLPVDSQYCSPVEALNLIVES